MKRKKIMFLSWLLALIALPLVTCILPPLPSYAASSDMYKWRLQAVGPRGCLETDVVVRFADLVKQASNGRMVITVYGADEIVPSFETFDAISRGILEMHCNDPSYWVGKTGNCSGIIAIPFLFPTALDQKVFLESKGALEVLREVYAKHNIYLINMFRAGDGTIWTKFPFSNIEDFNGKKIRAHGLWAEAFSKVGISTVTMPGGEVYEGLERGVIDGLVSANVAWCFDYGFHEASKYVYPSSNINICHLEFAVNMDAWKKLPEDLKSIITVCAKEAELEMLSQNHNWDAGRLKEAKDKWGITTQSLDQDSRNKLSKVMLEAVGQYEKSDPSFAKLATILKDYMKEMGTQ